MRTLRPRPIRPDNSTVDAQSATSMGQAFSRRKRRLHIEVLMDVDKAPLLRERFRVEPIFSKAYQAECGVGPRGLDDAQVAELRGKRYTLEQRRALGLY